MSQVGIGGREDGPEQQGQSDGDAGKQPHGQRCAGDDGQGQADEHEPRDEHRVHLEALEPDRGCGTEQDERQRDLRQDAESPARGQVFGGDSDPQDADGSADGQECERGGDRDTAEPLRDKSVRGDRQRDQADGEIDADGGLHGA